MCVRISFDIPQEALPHRGYELPDTGELWHRNEVVSAYSWPLWPVFTGERYQMMRWGLVPLWAAADPEKAASLRRGTVNARLETAAEKPSFRRAWRQGRGLIPVTAFYEYHHGEGAKSSHKLFLPGGEPFFLAGLWEPVGPRSIQGITDYPTFTVVTCAARGLPRQVHNSRERMPLLFSLEEGSRWLSGETAGTLWEKLICTPPLPPVSRGLF